MKSKLKWSFGHKPPIRLERRIERCPECAGGGRVKGIGVLLAPCSDHSLTRRL